MERFEPKSVWSHLFASLYFLGFSGSVGLIPGHNDFYDILQHLLWQKFDILWQSTSISSFDRKRQTVMTTFRPNGLADRNLILN